MSVGPPVRECIPQSRDRRLFFDTREEVISRSRRKGGNSRRDL